MEFQKRIKSPHALSAGKQKELFELGPPFPTRQLPICAEQLENSSDTRIYKNKKFQAWLAPWCSPPFGAWDALTRVKASSVGFGARKCTTLFTATFSGGAQCALEGSHLGSAQKVAQTNSPLAQPVTGQATGTDQSQSSYPSPVRLLNTSAQLVFRVG